MVWIMNSRLINVLELLKTHLEVMLGVEEQEPDIPRLRVEIHLLQAHNVLVPELAEDLGCSKSQALVNKVCVNVAYATSVSRNNKLPVRRPGSDRATSKRGKI